MRKTLKRLEKALEEISELPECSGSLKLPCRDLARRLKLLSALLREIMDSGEVQACSSLVPLAMALESAAALLRYINDGSKLYQALKMEEFSMKFLQVMEQLENSFSAIDFEELDVSEEALEQVELVRSQMRRARARARERNAYKNGSLLMDLSSVLGEKRGDPIILGRLSEKLQLTSKKEIKKEAMTVHEMVIFTGGEVEYLDEISNLLKQLTDWISSAASEIPPEERQSRRFPCIPEDFWCPISREIMRDPVTVSTGQTYERASIQRWLDAGHRTCPRTQKVLSHKSLAPNYLLKSLINQWCRSNELPSPRAQEPRCSPAELSLLVEKLQDGENPNNQRSAAGEIRLLAKRNSEDRIRIVNAGVVESLVKLLRSPDRSTQEHAITAILNLSIEERNKTAIASRALLEITAVLKEGKSSEARENAAAVVLSLSGVDGAKAQIGAAGALPALIEVLRHGTPRGMKDSAAALFSLCVYQPNRLRAARAGLVAPLMDLVQDPAEETAEEAMALVALMASFEEGRMAMEKVSPVKTLVEVTRRSCSASNREQAAAALWCLCSGSPALVKEAAELGAAEAMKELCESGTSRAKRKAKSLLELFPSVEQ